MRYILFSLIYMTLLTESVHAEIYRSWETICQNGCRTFTITKVPIFSDLMPYLVLLEIDRDNQVIVSGLDTEEQHYDVFTNKAPLELKRGEISYVPARGFFKTKLRYSLLVDGIDVLKLSTFDESHLGGTWSMELLKAFRRGSTAKLIHSSTDRGKGQGISFSLMGFSAAYAARNGLFSSDIKTTQVNTTKGPTMSVLQHLSGNRYSFKHDDLNLLPNPYGEGMFVYIPEVRIEGKKLWFYWFVTEGQVIVLNGHTKGLTPRLPTPMDTSYTLWHNTGLTSRNVAERGRELIFTR